MTAFSLRTRTAARVSEGCRSPGGRRDVRSAGPGQAPVVGSAMFGELPSRDKPLLEIGVLGAPESGKTTLAQALAARALHRRGRPIPRRRPSARLLAPPAVVEMETPSRRYRLLDWRGEAECVRGMLDRVGGWAGAVLVVPAAAETIGPLRRYVWLARQVGVPEILVFLSRAEDAAPARLEWLEAEVRRLLHAEGFPGDEAPVLAGDAWSALCSGGKSDAVCRPIDDVLAALDLRLRPPTPAVDKPFRMTVEEVSFLRRGLFTVAAGRIQQGRVEVGDRIEVAGPPDAAPTPRVVGLRQFHRSLAGAEAGDRVGVMLRRRLVTHLSPGQLLCRPGSLAAPRQFEAVVFQPPSSNGSTPPRLRDGEARLAFAGHDANVRYVVVGPTAQLAWGQAARVRIDLDAAAGGVYEGMRFELRWAHATAGGAVARVM